MSMNILVNHQLKRTMDPNGIMGPDTMPIMDDYL
jgi:hypothetical protein